MNMLWSNSRYIIVCYAVFIISHIVLFAQGRNFVWYYYCALFKYVLENNSGPEEGNKGKILLVMNACFVFIITGSTINKRINVQKVFMKYKRAIISIDYCSLYSPNQPFVLQLNCLIEVLLFHVPVLTSSTSCELFFRLLDSRVSFIEIKATVKRCQKLIETGDQWA